MATEQRHVHFSGTVQGVGFRFTACRIAANYGIDGYVRNLPDGRVECVVEGDSGRIDAFMEEITQTMQGYVRECTQQKGPYTGRLGPFTVRY